MLISTRCHDLEFGLQPLVVSNIKSRGIYFLAVHAKDSTPEFEAVEQQLADEDDDIFNPKGLENALCDEPNFVKPPIPKSKARMSAASTESEYSCWGDVVRILTE